MVLYGFKPMTRVSHLLWALVLSLVPSVLGAGPPNVLMIVVDDLNCDLGCYGHQSVQSPHIDRLAAKGIRFVLAYCQYPVCNPSRSSFMTGRYPEETGVLSNAGQFRKALPDALTLGQHFQQHGYFVARVGKIFHYGVPAQIGTSGADDPASWQEVRNPRGIDKDVEDRIHSLQKGKFGGTLSWLSVESDDKEHTDGVGASQAIELMESHHPEKTGKPFFLAVGFYRPHTPYVAPAHYFDRYSREQIQPVMLKPGDRDDIPIAALPDRPRQLGLSTPQRREIIQAYYASISLMDAQTGRLLNALDRLRLAENTIVVFFSDHGYHLGAHGLWQKSDLFEGSSRVPLIISDPSRRKHRGVSTTSLAELVDLYPTLAELAGLPEPAHVSGVSLAPTINDPQVSVRDSALTVTVSRTVKTKGKERVLGHSVRTTRHRYTEWGDRQFGVELYDYLSDPEEYTNLAVLPGNEALTQTMRRLLHRRREDIQQ